MNAKDIKDLIFANIADLIGTYTQGSVTIPALWIGLPPQNFVCTGLEVLVQEYPETSNHGNQILCEYWKINLTQFEGDSNLLEATTILRSLLRPCRVTFIQKPVTTELQDLSILPQSIIVHEHKQVLK